MTLTFRVSDCKPSGLSSPKGRAFKNMTPFTQERSACLKKDRVSTKKEYSNERVTVLLVISYDHRDPAERKIARRKEQKEESRE